MPRPPAHLLFLLSVALLVALAGCKSKSPCTSSAQCANGYACNAESMSCELEASSPDASTDAAELICPGDTHRCAPLLPADWSGPVIGTEVAIDAVLAECPEGSDGEELQVFSELISAGGCDCSCPGVSSGVQCGSATIAARTGTNALTCSQGCLNCSVFIPPDGSCQTFPGGDNAEIVQSSAIRVSLGKVTNTGTCSAPIESNDLVASFAEQARYCQAAPVEGSCPAQGTCVPKPDDESFDALCIYRSGDQACPAEYPEKRLRFQDLDDTRECSSCICAGPAVDSSCAGVVQISPKNVSVNCGLSAVSTSSCVSKSPDLGISASYTPATSFDCTQQSGAELSGEATETGPLTFCCTGQP